MTLITDALCIKTSVTRVIIDAFYIDMSMIRVIMICGHHRLVMGDAANPHL